MERINEVVVSSKQLLKNLEIIKKMSGNKKICAMVKANAYGLGIEKICKILECKVEFFGVANINEALEVRKICPNTKVLIVGKTTNFSLCAKNKISVTIDGKDQLEKLVSQINQNNIKDCINIHIKINSGMNRLGIKSENEFKETVKICEKNKINIEGVSTHFSTADCDTQFFQKQKKKFEKFLDLIPKRFSPIVHVGGSAVVLQKPFEYDMLRVGIGLYGFLNGTKVRSVVKVRSKIIKIVEVEKGERVGYSNGFIASKKTKIAVLPIGYADGVSRNLSGRIKVLVNGKKCLSVGKICMDMMFVDVSGEKVFEGQEVFVLFDVKKWAQILSTIPYEILTSLSLVR